MRNPEAHWRAIWRFIRECAADPRTPALAAQIIEHYRIPQRAPRTLVEGFLRYAQSIKFFQEWPERHCAPWVTAEWNLGDCDDKVILFACLCMAFRIPVRLIFIDIELADRRIFHVYAQANVDGEWLSAEPVLDWPLGKDTITVARERGLPIYSVQVVGD